MRLSLASGSADAVKSFDDKLRAIASGNYTPSRFILADAKDPDMAFGVAATGIAEDAGGATRYRTVVEFRERIRAIVKQGEVDVMLASVANIEALAGEGLFETSAVTPAIRANDTTDIWLPRGGTYRKEPSRPFRSANLAHARNFCDLCLYSVTFNNVLDRDHEAAEAYGRFRGAAGETRFPHFLEVFNPNAPRELDPAIMPFFVNDMIIRLLAGIARVERPAFLKIVFNGRRALEELASNDPSLVIGILGGPAGTTRDCFELLSQAARSGARAAVFGPKIDEAVSPLDLMALFRPVLEGAIATEEAVHAYHAALQEKSLRPKRPLADDLLITDPVLEGYRP